MTGPPSEHLLIEIRRLLSQTAYRVCPAWLASHREDIVQIAMLRILDAAKKRGEANPDLSSLYIGKAVFSATVDEIRRHRRRKEDPSPESDRDETPSATSASPETLVASREIADGMRDCLARLPAPRMMAVTLHLQGHSVPEVASILRWNAKRANNLIYRGLTDLRRCLITKGLTP